MINELARDISQTERIAVLTGAGMSTESGLPDFRSKDGLWRQHRPEELASVDALHQRSLLFYEFYRFRLELLKQAAPNPAHRALVELERQGRLQTIVTQNVDGFHTEAGSRTVIEIHGTLRQARCHDCDRVHPIALLEKPIKDLSEAPRCTCGGLIRPGVVLFGEMLPQKALSEAVEAMEICDGLLIIGSSLQVQPAASLPQMVIERSPGWYWLTIHDRRATKAQAIQTLRDNYGLDGSELVVFGDHNNDLEMFQIADRSIAMSNATAELKGYATQVIGSNEEDSVVRFLLDHWNSMDAGTA